MNHHYDEIVGAAMLTGGGATALQTANDIVQLAAAIVATIGGLILIYRFFVPAKDKRIDEIIDRLDRGSARMDAIDQRNTQQDARMDGMSGEDST